MNYQYNSYIKTCGVCDKTDGICYTSNPPKVRCTITGEFHLHSDICSVSYIEDINSKNIIRYSYSKNISELPDVHSIIDRSSISYIYMVGENENKEYYLAGDDLWIKIDTGLNKDKMTIDKLIEICDREYKRGMSTAFSSKFDEGYAHAMRLCLSFAKELKNDMNLN